MGGGAPIFVQIAERILADLGDPLVPGTALPGERDLAVHHQVSRGTVIAALDHLAKRRLIDRLPARGSFVAEAGAGSPATRRILLPYPEPGLSPEYLHPENLGISTELLRGVLDEALARGHAVLFQHFPEPADDRQLAGQFRQIEDCDGAIFVSHQLGQLRHCLKIARKPCAMVASYGDSEAGVALVTNELPEACDRLAAHLAARGYTCLAALLPPPSHPGIEVADQLKITFLRAAAARHGLAFPAERVLRMSIGAVAPVAEAIATRLATNPPPGEAVFCSRTDYVEALHHLAAEGRIEARSCRYFGLASGVTFRSYAPRPTYIHVDFYAMGRAALVAVVQGDASVAPTIIASRLVIGDST